MSTTAKIIFGILIIGMIVLIVFMFIKNSNEEEVLNLNNNENTNQITNENINMTDSKVYTFPGVLPDERIMNKKATIETNKGNIEFELYPDDAPKTVSNFVYLTEEGYYDGLTFHRVEPGFVIQGGDPDGVGTGGPGYKFEDEPITKKYDQGIVAMANSGPDTNGSQFFIMLEDKEELPPNYTIFGKVISGMDVVQQIEVGDVMSKVLISDK
ncbi:MAG: peptidylprolyl isomerase [bacterium]|nr:peptidylprolyl isomerase [bacterium]